MKKNRNSFRLYLCFTAVLAGFALTLLLECLPLSLASTSPATTTPPPKGRGFFGRLSPKKGPIDEETSDEVEETKKKSSWQFFYKRNEDTTTENKDESQNDGGKSQEVSDEGEEGKDQTDVEEEADIEDSENENAEKNEDPDGASESEDKEDETQKSDKVETGEKEQDAGSNEKTGASETTNSGQQYSQDPMQRYRNQLMQHPRFLSPGTIVYRSPSSPYGNQQQPPGITGQGSGMAITAVVNLLTVATRLFVLKWIMSKLASDAESKSPVQHFMWECLNDKYIKDDEIWNRVLSRVPKSMGVSKRIWGNTVRAMSKSDALVQKKTRSSKKTRNKKVDPKNQKLIVSKSDENPTESNLEKSPETSKTVVVMDFSTMDVAEPEFLHFADIVTFLVGSNSQKKQMFGKEPEILLKVLSPGGEVTSFAFAAAQVARLRDAGWKVTVCVDRIAASGGYMIASQATQILASPFAMVGSVGVISQSLNFYEILKKYGVKSLVLKAGDSKNPITQFGEVTDEDVKTTQIDLDETHQSFIDLCRSRRPTLDPAVCNGRILSGEMALERGMIDRILTSDEYILEKITEGDLVMKLHLVSGNSERSIIAMALQILPHLRSRFKKFVSTTSNNNLVGKLNAAIDGNCANKVIQIMGITSMIRRAFMRSGPF